MLIPHHTTCQKMVLLVTRSPIPNLKKMGQINPDAHRTHSSYKLKFTLGF